MDSFSVLHWLIAAAIGYALFSVFRRRKSGDFVCKSCGSRQAPTTVTKGSIGVEIFLWLLLIVPGLLYSIWRLTTRHTACSDCGGAELIPADSPIGRKIISELAPK